MIDVNKIIDEQVARLKAIGGVDVLSSNHDIASEFANQEVWFLENSGAYKGFPSHFIENLMDIRWREFYEQKMLHLTQIDEEAPAPKTDHFCDSCDRYHG